MKTINEDVTDSFDIWNDEPSIYNGNGTINSDIKTSHKEFSGRVLSLEDIMKNRSNAYKFVL